MAYSGTSVENKQLDAGKFLELNRFYGLKGTYAATKITLINREMLM